MYTYIRFKNLAVDLKLPKTGTKDILRKNIAESLGVEIGEQSGTYYER
jgi:hypothetical protein